VNSDPKFSIRLKEKFSQQRAEQKSEQEKRQYAENHAQFLFDVSCSSS